MKKFIDIRTSSQIHEQVQDTWKVQIYEQDHRYMNEFTDTWTSSQIYEQVHRYEYVHR